HDVYQDHPDHVRFIEGHKEKWANVKVMDMEPNA
ncbi:MAG: Dabb family protein, partial [Alphaproteobacteria bacterium]